MLSLEELLINCYVSLFCSKLRAKFDEKQARFQEINGNLDSPESFRTFPGILCYIPRNLLKHSPESFISFPGIFLSIPRDF